MKWEKRKGVPFCLYGVTKENFAKLEAWFPGKFDITYHRDEADYVYESEKLATLSGKSCTASGITSINLKHFTEITGVTETIAEDSLEECFQMALKWRNLNGCEDDEEKNSEMCVTLNSLRLYKELNLIGGLLRVGDEIVAFTIGEAVNDDTFVVHIEKAYADIEGAYTMINQQFVEHEIAGKYKYTNREDDVGEEGLRKAKLSYKPVFMVEKVL